MVEETFEPGMTVSLVAADTASRQNVAPIGGARQPHCRRQRRRRSCRRRIIVSDALAPFGYWLDFVLGV